MTPDTGSDDESDEMEGGGDRDRDEKDGSEEYELREGARLKHEEDVGAGASGERRRRRRHQRHLYTAEEERSVVRKFDKKLVVFLAVLYMLSFLDRSSPFPPPPLTLKSRPC